MTTTSTTDTAGTRGNKWSKRSQDHLIFRRKGWKWLKIGTNCNGLAVRIVGVGSSNLLRSTKEKEDTKVSSFFFGMVFTEEIRR